MIFVLDIQMETLLTTDRQKCLLNGQCCKLMLLGQSTKPNRNGIEAGKQKFFNCDYTQTDFNCGFLPCMLFVLPQSNKILHTI